LASDPKRPLGLWRLAKAIAIEGLYQGIRGRAEFQSGSQEQATRALRRTAILTPVMQLLLFASFSAMFGLAAIFELEQGGEASAVVRGSFFLMLLLAFLIALMTTAQTMATILDLGLLEPVRSLPLSDRRVRRAASFAWLLTQGSGAAAWVVPGAAIVSVYAGSPALLFLALWWAAIFLVLGHLIGLQAASYLQASGSSQRKSVLGTFRRIMGILSAFLVIALWQIIFQLQEPLADLLRPVGGGLESLWPIFPFTAFSSIASALERAVAPELVLLSAAYGIGFLYLYERSAARFWRVAFEPPLLPGLPRARAAFRPSRLATRSPALGLAAKDLRLIFRKPQVAVMLFIPLLIVIPFLVAPAAEEPNGDGGAPPLLQEFGWAILGLQLAGVAALLSTSPSVFLVGEGKSAWVLRTLPLSKRAIIWGKAIAAMIPFACYFPVLVWLMAWRSSLEASDTLLLLAILGSSALSVVIAGLRYLLHRLPPDATTFTQDTFGRFMALPLLGLSFGIAALPIILGVTVTLFGGGVLGGELMALATSLVLLGILIGTLPPEERRTAGALPSLAA